MLYDVSYRDDNITRAINLKVGKPFSIWRRFKLKGIGSRRMVIHKISTSHKEKLHGFQDTIYSIIELRPKGIIVYINNGLQTLAWVVPFHLLTIQKARFISFHAEGQFIQYKSSYANIKSFVDKVFKMRYEALRAAS
ncbi:hypothetical protein [Sediminitomix flava]|uniref:Uncharacterized protein n=1 Tax=Sediminitomix flava TaxID=379075 RepID=A0A315Z9F7_SEDFL|nr:hypothetical protein [Sediminitomix flava]PWJ40186.1 hypothetical protein BC781_105254 [Sediminitomix flava]